MGSEENDVKLRILQAAKKLFARQGFNATTVRQICEEAGANVSLVSYYFGGKDKVFDALFTEYFSHDILEGDRLSRMDAVSGLKLLIREITAYRLREPEMISLLQQEIIMQSPRMDKIQELTLPIWTLLRDWLKLGRDQGVFRFRSLDHTFISVLGSILFHNKTFYFNQILDNSEENPDLLMEDLTQFIFQAIGYEEQA
ncbi:transcriptional regulator, TetR family [Paenibacillus sophorae]|uniref:TetR family transcriptional regulator n=1 Tax=Paenibacillus sophorae TaxID=1333845 RepID=A0A1H8FD48_9BACL|nr:TetR/AcrR family transcriptional regulator [Paenibacillus sophorae]QWU13837.1 TetR family transcriptional regulator [Paenibacillus sophorae]SEN29536.1 transcriptional regulator, TetR family [Paenibacillus sophorae]